MAKNKGDSYSPPTRAEIEAMRAEKMQLVPNGEAGRRERKLLEHYSAAQADLQWIVDNNAWHELGFDTFTGWYAARVRPAVAAAGLRPTQEFALYVLENVQSDEARLPKQQRLLQRELADLVGVSVSTLRRLSQDPPQASNDAGVDLEDATDLDPADVSAAMTQLLTEAAAASVGAGVTMPAARPAESPCSDAPDRAHCARAGCGVELSGNDQNSGHLRCLTCDPSTLHKAVGIGVEEGYGECDECAIQARIAERTSAAVTAANTGGVFPPVGEPDVDVEAASTSGIQTAAGPEVEVSPSPAVGSYGVPALHDPGVSAVPAAGTPVPDGDGDGSVAVRDNPEERIEEEAASPRERIPLPVYCHDCKSIDERCEQHRDSSAATFSSTAAFRLISPAADLDDASQGVLQQPGPDSPTGREAVQPHDGRSETDHHMSAGVSDSGVAPAIAVEPVLEGGGLAPDPSSSSDPRDEPTAADRLLHALAELVEVLDEMDPEAMGPYLFPAELVLLHQRADRIAEFVGRVGLARSGLVHTP